MTKLKKSLEKSRWVDIINNQTQSFIIKNLKNLEITLTMLGTSKSLLEIRNIINKRV